jgi:hypothetical protein
MPSAPKAAITMPPTVFLMAAPSDPTFVLVVVAARLVLRVVPVCVVVVALVTEFGVDELLPLARAVA